jgi:hypothetical protein
MHATIKPVVDSWERLSTLPICCSNPEFLRILVSYDDGPLARYLGPMSVILRYRHWDRTELVHAEIPDPRNPRKRNVVRHLRAKGLYCIVCVGEIDGDGGFILMRDGSHGPFCGDSCAESFAMNHDENEPPASMFDPEGV